MIFVTITPIPQILKPCLAPKPINQTEALYDWHCTPGRLPTPLPDSTGLGRTFARPKTTVTAPLSLATASLGAHVLGNEMTNALKKTWFVNPDPTSKSCDFQGSSYSCLGSWVWTGWTRACCIYTRVWQSYREYESVFEGSLEAKLPTIWADGRAQPGRNSDV